MKLASAFLGLIAAAVLAVVLGVASRVTQVELNDLLPQTGMTLIEAHRCLPAETKHVMVRGIEDAFAGAGNEPAGRHPRLEGLDFDMPLPNVGYDTLRPDTHVTDYFPFPPNTASGIVVIRIRRTSDNTNDVVLLGDFTTLTRGSPAERARVYAAAPTELTKNGWTNRGDVYWASLGDLPLSAGGTVLDLVHDGERAQAVDVDIGDDTAVDFIAAVACQRPPGGKGVTLVAMKPMPTNPKVVTFTCRGTEIGMADCNPFAGDQTCDSELPLLCFADRDLPVPRSSSRIDANYLTRNWSGGEVAATAPVAAASFKTIVEADRHCARTFGVDWRVAEWHLSGRGTNFAALGNGTAFTGRYWIDVRGAPYGTCWRRADD